MKRMMLILATALLAVGMLVPAAQAEDYPTKPITMIVPWGAGGMTDTSTRMLAEEFKKLLGQPMVVVNKPGGSGIVGLKSALSNKPDGYTLVMGPLTLALTSPYFLDAEPFDPNDVEYVGSYMPQERVLFATPDQPFDNLDEMIAYVKEHPGEISAGSGGAQWALEVVKSIAVKNDLKMKYVMFKSGGEASAAILGGHVNVCETGVGTLAYQAAREGKLKVIVDLGANKIPGFEDVPNLEGLGYPFTTLLEYGIGVPAGTPEDIRQKLEDTLNKALENKDLISKMEAIGLTPRFLSGADYKAICVKAVESIPALTKYNEAVK